MSARAQELVRKIEADNGAAYPLYSDRSEGYKKAMEMFAAAGDLERATQARIEWLLFAFRETETFGTGGYFGPRFTKPDGTPFPDFYSMPPNTRDYLKQRALATTNPLHRSRYADFVWDKFRDAETGPTAVTAYIDCAKLYLDRGESALALRAIRRACHLAGQFKQRDLQTAAKDAGLAVIGRLMTSAEISQVPRAADAVLGLGDVLSETERSGLCEQLEQVRASFVSVRDYHLERATLKALRQLYAAGGQTEAERRAWLAEGESYEAEGDYKFRIEGAGGGPIVASQLYQMALKHFQNMAETSRLETLKQKIKEANKYGPTNFQEFVEQLRPG
jgi:tetratricopeptide (TPR) repeat protein